MMHDRNLCRVLAAAAAFFLIAHTGFTQERAEELSQTEIRSNALAPNRNGAVAGFAEGRRAIPRHGIYELALRAAVARRNPYRNGLGVAVTFTGMAGAALGRTVTVQGFWEGGQTFRVRFSPPAEGTWQWRSVSTDTGLHDRFGTLVCAGKLAAGHISAAGHVREAQANPFTFAHEDGTPFFLLGDTQWSFSTSAITWPNEFQTYVEARAEQGFNYIHGVIYQIWPPGNAANEGGLPFYAHNVDSLNPGFWRAFDQRVAHMNEKGMVAGLMLGWADDAWKYFSTRAQVERYVQYVINRYAAYNVFWIVAGEYEESAPPGGHAGIGEYLRRNDPYQHPRTIHTVHTSATEFGAAAWQTTIYQQIFHARQVTPDRRYNKPVINSEFGYEGDQTPEEVRQDAWEIVMRGGFFVYGDTNTFHASAVMTPKNLYSPGAAFMNVLKNFWTNTGKHEIKWWQFDRFEEVGPRRFLAGKRGAEYVVYADTLGAFTIDLTDLSGNVFGQWFNTKTGRWGATFGGNARARFTITPPAAGSVAYLTPRADITPPAILALQAKLLSGTTAHLTWQTNEPATAQVEYGLTDKYGALAEYQAGFNTSHEAVINGLMPDTTYHLRALAADAGGNVAMSAEVVLKTRTAPAETLTVTNIVLLDSLDGQSKGERTGGRFVREGGWQVTDPDNMIVYDLGRYLEHGAFEVDVSGFHPQTQNFFTRHHLMSMFRNPWGNHHPIENTETVWDLHAGYAYQPGVKMLSWTYDENEQTTATTKSWNANRTYRFKITWRGKQVQFFIDDELQTTHTHSAEMALRYLFLGRDRTISGDLITNFMNNQYPALGGPIFSNLVVQEILSPLNVYAPEIAAVTVGDLYANAARITWQTSEPSVCYMEYGTTVQYGERTPVLGASATSFSATLANLKPGQTYRFRIVALDEGRKTAFSRNHVFTTRTGGVYLFKPAADTFVEDAGVNAETRDHANFGFMSLILSAGREAYLRFNVAGVNEPFAHATLRLHGRQSGFSGGVLRVLPGLWEENNVTWLTKPTRFGTELGRFTRVEAGSWHETRLDSMIMKNGNYSFALIGTGKRTVAFDSRESTNAQPELIVFTTQSGESATGVQLAHEAERPTHFEMRQHPNPFRDYTRFEIALPEAGEIALKIFDVQGREVANLLGDKKTAGRFEVSWNGLDQARRKIAAGVYFAVLRYRVNETSAPKMLTQRLVHLK